MPDEGPCLSSQICLNKHSLYDKVKSFSIYHRYNSTTSTQMNKFIHLNNRYNESPYVKSTINVQRCFLCAVRSIAVGQWLVSGLHWSSSARQSLAARQKELSEQYKLILKRQNCIENGLNLCNFLTSFSSFFYLSFLLSIFFLFFAFFSLFFCLQCTTEPDCTTKWAFN